MTLPGKHRLIKAEQTELSKNILLFCYKTKVYYRIVVPMTRKQLLILHLRMQLATLKQVLRDQADELTENEKNQLIDRIAELLKIIRGLEEA
ncbi:hypothetical protein GCM10028804_03960 [Larkinella terrae]